MKILTHDEMMQLKESNYEEFLSYIKEQMENNNSRYLNMKDWQINKGSKMLNREFKKEHRKNLSKSSKGKPKNKKSVDKMKQALKDKNPTYAIYEGEYFSARGLAEKLGIDKKIFGMYKKRGKNPYGIIFL